MLYQEVTVRIINPYDTVYIALINDNDGFNTYVEYAYPPSAREVWEYLRETYERDFEDVFDEALKDENGALIITDRGVPAVHSPFVFEDHTD